ncbi:MAG: hypothetical protein AAB368_00460, partial [bacterium]
ATYSGEPGEPGELSGEALENLNRCVRVVECWDKDEGAVHYITESGGYDGFLEKDAKYPYFDHNARSVLKDWYPIRACVPVVHNLRTPERTIGIPWLEPGRDHAIAYVAFDTALTASRKKAGRIVEYPDDLPNEQLDALKNGADLTLIPRPAEMEAGKALFFVYEFGKAPFDFEAAKQSSLQSFARCVDMSVEEISGISIAPTLGQSEKASQGAQASRGGLIRKLERFAGEVVRDLGALARLLYSDERVTAMMGPEFTTRRPMMKPAAGPDGMPVIGPDGAPQMSPVMHPDTGEPLMMPSVWDLFKGSAMDGDVVEVSFGALEQSLMERKSNDDMLALQATPAGINPLSGLPWWDPRPIWERVYASRRMGRPKPFPEPPPAPPMQEQPEKPSGGDKREAPGGGRDDGRKGGGMRGPPNVPGRQSRGQMGGGGDMGDMSTKVN